MDKTQLDQLRFPVGKFKRPENIDVATRNAWIATIEQFPTKVADATANLSKEALNWQYRPDGWTIKQVVHHCADSHMNSLIRFKLSLTEDEPIIKPYAEAKWAELVDAVDNDISDSVALLGALHRKWVKVLRAMDDADFARIFVHPESKFNYRLDVATALYEWHCRHHFGHIEQALRHKGQF